MWVCEPLLFPPIQYIGVCENGDLKSCRIVMVASYQMIYIKKQLFTSFSSLTPHDNNNFNNNHHDLSHIGTSHESEKATSSSQT